MYDYIERRDRFPDADSYLPCCVLCHVSHPEEWIAIAMAVVVTIPTIIPINNQINM